MKKTALILSALIIALLCIGCFEEEDSCNIRTPGIYVEYFVAEQDGRANVEATFWVGDEPYGTYLELGACGDTIRVNGERLYESGVNPTRYKGIVPKSDDYYFAFERPEEDTYVSAIIGAPPPVVVEAPDGEAFARDEEMSIAWQDNWTGQASIQVTGSCFHTFYARVTDNGAYTVDPFDLVPFAGCEMDECPGTVKVTRDVQGDLSGHLKGTISGRVEGRAYFDSTPGTFELPFPQAEY